MLPFRQKARFSCHVYLYCEAHFLPPLQLKRKLYTLNSKFDLSWEKLFPCRVLSVQDRMPFERLLLSVHDKKSAVQTTRGIRSDSAFRDTLHLHNVEIKTNNYTYKGHSFVTEPFFVGLIAWQMSRCLLFFSHVLHRNQRTRCQNKTTCFYALWDSGTSIHAVLQSASFPSSRKGKIDSEAPISMNSELTEKSYRYKMDENNYKPTKSQRHPCLESYFVREWNLRHSQLVA